MNRKLLLKEFFRITERKMVTFSILVLIALFSVFIVLMGFTSNASMVSEPSNVGIAASIYYFFWAYFWVIAAPLIALMQLVYVFPFLFTGIYFYFLLAVNVFYIYFLSCTFTWIDNRIKKKIRIPSIAIFLILIFFIGVISYGVFGEAPGYTRRNYYDDKVFSNALAELEQATQPTKNYESVDCAEDEALIWNWEVQEDSVITDAKKVYECIPDPTNCNPLSRQECEASGICKPEFRPSCPTCADIAYIGCYSR